MYKYFISYHGKAKQGKMVLGRCFITSHGRIGTMERLCSLEDDIANNANLESALILNYQRLDDEPEEKESTDAAVPCVFGNKCPIRKMVMCFDEPEAE